MTHLGRHTIFCGSVGDLVVNVVDLEWKEFFNHTVGVATNFLDAQLGSVDQVALRIIAIETYDHEIVGHCFAHCGLTGTSKMFFYCISQSIDECDAIGFNHIESYVLCVVCSGATLCAHCAYYF